MPKYFSSWLGASALVATLLFASGSTVAQPKDNLPAKPRSAASLECSKQADEKGLHGKARKKFRSKCLKDLKKKAA
jgi:psiF repeat